MRAAAAAAAAGVPAAAVATAVAAPAAAAAASAYELGDGLGVDDPLVGADWMARGAEDDSILGGGGAAAALMARGLLEEFDTAWSARDLLAVL